MVDVKAAVKIIGLRTSFPDKRVNSKIRFNCLCSALKMKKSFIYLRKISVMVCVYEILSQRECWDTYELKEIVLFPEILLLGVNSIIYMYINYHYYNTQMSSLKNQHAIQWTTGGSE